MKTKNLLTFIFFFFSIATSQAQWVQKGADILGVNAFSSIGLTVSMSADASTIAFRSNSNTGLVHISEWNGSSWIQKGANIPAENNFDKNGWSLSLSMDGNTLAIGAPYNDGTANEAGHVRIYDWNGSAWIQKGDDIDGDDDHDYSGCSVSISSDGSTLAVGASGNDDGASFAGHVRIYEWNGTTWANKGSAINGLLGNGGSGKILSMTANGNTIAICTPLSGPEPIPFSNPPGGYVRIFEWDGAFWVQKGSNISASCASISISADANTVALGYPYADAGIWNSTIGQTKVFQWNGNDWVQKGNDLNGDDLYNFSGYSVSLSSDGNILAVGNPIQNGDTLYSSYVRVHKWDGVSWVQEGSDIVANGAGDQSGRSISLSADGSTLAIGAPQIYVNAPPSNGYVQCYQFPQLTLEENTFEKELSVFPNPTEGTVSIRLGEPYENTKVTLTSLTGQELQTGTYNSIELLTININEPAGFYLLVVEADEQKAVTRLVKK